MAVNHHDSSYSENNHKAKWNILSKESFPSYGDLARPAK